MSKNDFKPYIPAERVTPEITAASVITGIVLAVVFGAANAYLGLRVGMTVSASIPAAVISMGVLRKLMRRSSVLESNIVQTIGSAGESLAAGAIFTMPVLFLWGDEGIGTPPSIMQITLTALCGGILGVFFMIPLRNALIVKEHSVLLYPEGTACADVLLAGESGSTDSSAVFGGMGAAAAFKLIADGLKVVPADISRMFRSFGGEIGIEIYPSLTAVGYIIGPRIASYMFCGAVMGWMVIIPAIYMFGSQTIMYPGTVPIGQMMSEGGASALWSSYLRYIGAGAIAAGGLISLIKSLPLIFSTFLDSVGGLKSKKGTSAVPRTEKSFSGAVTASVIFITAVLIWLLPSIPVGFMGAVGIVIFGFFFAAVSSRMVGLVGSSNNPVSGMCIATLIITASLFKASGADVLSGMTGSIIIGSVICIIAAMAGDTSQDLKTGYILGATPIKQQIGEIIGACVSALAIGGVLYLLNNAWGYGSAEVPAPQATLMKMIVEGIMGGELPWGLVFIGVFLGICMEIVGIPVMPFAIGLYLPIYLSSGIMAGGIVRGILDRRSKTDSETKIKQASRGTLYCAGMIAGDGLAGILLAVLAVFGFGADISEKIYFGAAGGAALYALMIASLVGSALKSGKRSKKK